jgi:diguanylate cyclase (GGDEF)-like protein/PAS domain S-box-containing protein
MKREQSWFEVIYRQVPTGIAGLASDGTLSFVNPAGCAMLGYTEAELIGLPVRRLLFSDDPLQFDSSDPRLAGQQHGAPRVIRWRHQQGHTIWMQVVFTQLDVEPMTGIRLLQFHDVTVRQEELLALRQTEQRQALVLDSAGLGAWDCDLRTGSLILNRPWYTMLDYEPEDVEASLERTRQLVHPDDIARVTKAFDAHIRGETARFDAEYRMRTRAGEWRWILGRGCVVERDATGLALRAAGTHLDVTARKREQEHARHLSLHDVLTDLPNQRLLQDRLFVALNSARRSRETVAVVFVDLDNFKSINDGHGHGVGDVVLQVAAKRLRIAMRGHDTVARVGGDEFVLVLTRCDSRVTVEQTVDRLLDELAQPITIGSASVHLEASAGIALFPQHATDAQSLLRCADIAMYAAKRKGKGCSATYDAFAMLQQVE